MEMRISELRDLLACKMKDDNLRQFQETWDMCLMSQRDESIRTNTHLQHTLYYAQIYNHPLLKDDIAHYLRKPDGPCKRTYAWFHDALVENKSMQDIEEQHTKNMRDNNPELNLGAS